MTTCSKKQSSPVPFVPVLFVPVPFVLVPFVLVPSLPASFPVSFLTVPLTGFSIQPDYGNPGYGSIVGGMVRFRLFRAVSNINTFSVG